LFDKWHTTYYALEIVGLLKYASQTLAQMPNRTTDVEIATVSPTIANTMLAACPYL